MEDTKIIARINGKNIIVIENGEQLVPIRPICEILGIAYQGQIDKIKNDDILGSTIMPGMTVGADNKSREMTCIPYRFIFGWLFTINPANVNPEAKEAVVKYKMECYNALYDHFSAQSKFMKEKQDAIYKQEEVLGGIREEFNTAKNRLKEEQQKFKDIFAITFEDWKENNRQLSIQFEN
jgi:hypothetical protein